MHAAKKSVQLKHKPCMPNVVPFCGFRSLRACTHQTMGADTATHDVILSTTMKFAATMTEMTSIKSELVLLSLQHSCDFLACFCPRKYHLCFL